MRAWSRWMLPVVCCLVIGAGVSLGVAKDAKDRAVFRPVGAQPYYYCGPSGVFIALRSESWCAHSVELFGSIRPEDRLDAEAAAADPLAPIPSYLTDPPAWAYLPDLTGASVSKVPTYGYGWPFVCMSISYDRLTWPDHRAFKGAKHFKWLGRIYGPGLVLNSICFGAPFIILYMLLPMSRIRRHLSARGLA